MSWVSLENIWFSWFWFLLVVSYWYMCFNSNKYINDNLIKNVISVFIYKGS